MEEESRTDPLTNGTVKRHSFFFFSFSCIRLDDQASKAPSDPSFETRTTNVVRSLSSLFLLLPPQKNSKVPPLRSEVGLLPPPPPRFTIQERCHSPPPLPQKKSFISFLHLNIDPQRPSSSSSSLIFYSQGNKIPFSSSDFSHLQGEVRRNGSSCVGGKLKVKKFEFRAHPSPFFRALFPSTVPITQFHPFSVLPSCRCQFSRNLFCSLSYCT